MDAQRRYLNLREAEASPCNRVFILNALSVHEVNSAKKIHKYIESVIECINEVSESAIDPGSVRYIDILSRGHLLKFFQEIEGQCADGVLPIIHIEAHGDKKKGIEIPGDGCNQYVSWEQLVRNLRKINKACLGNLTVILAMCHSASIIPHTEVREDKGKLLGVPFFAAYYYTGSVLSSEIYQDLKILYEGLLHRGRPGSSGYSKRWGSIRELELIQIFLAYTVLATSDQEYLRKATDGAFSVRKMISEMGRNETRDIPPGQRRTRVLAILRNGELSRDFVKRLILDPIRRDMYLADISKYFEELGL